MADPVVDVVGAVADLTPGTQAPAERPAEAGGRAGAPTGAAAPARPSAGAASQTPPMANGTMAAVTEARPRRRRRHRHRLGTAARLAAFQTTVLAAVLGIVVIALGHQFSVSYQSIAASTLTGQLQSYAAAATRSATDSASLFAFSRRYLQTHSLPSGDQLVFAIPGQGVVGSAGTNSILAGPVTAAWIAAPPLQTQLQVVRLDGQDNELLAAPIDLKGRTVGTFLATTTLGSLEAQRTRVIELSIAEAAVALVAGGLSAYFLLRRLLRTVGRITSTAEEIHEGDLDKRLGDQGTDDEVAQLAGTFDAMLDRLSSVMHTQRRLLSDVSHQLRTPLTIARGHLEVLGRTGYSDTTATADSVGVVLDELSHMSSLVDSLLLLGRAIEPDFLELEPLDLRAFVADLYEAAVVLARRDWSVSAIPDMVLWADATKLRGALLNVVDNAVKVTRPGEAIAIVAEVAADGRSLLLAVDDAGPGIPPDQRETVLERFTRVPGQGVPGTGLGLAIVDAVARAHGGSVEITSSLLGGARVGVRLPADLRWRPEDGTP